MLGFGGFLSHGGAPVAGWFICDVYFMKNPNKHILGNLGNLPLASGKLTARPCQELELKQCC